MYILSHHVVVGGDFGQEGVGARCVVDVAAIVGESVGYDDIGYKELCVVPHNLVEGVLRNGYMGSLVFNKCQWGALGIVHYGVATTGHAVERKGYFITYASGRIATMRYKKSYKVLTYPLLGGEHYVSASRSIPDGDIAIGIAT